ncbi:hypothetical protein [Ruegeria sp. THAF33]|uniref:hypothetical protein n=1 Tax=Ruegeria sp. THAF33 TaxID=2587853 RepID=UPI0012679734|nr:hypothetical protein [Ruegeria sp. THAF33]QFT74866.1 hypothetical protein FIU92_17650 [Ruegeria sp. THAF33]
MTQEHLRKLWSVLGALLAFYAANAWIVSQGGNPIFDVDLIEDGPGVGSLVALPICAVLTILVSRIGTAYARRSGADAWHAKLPVVWLEGLDTSTSGGRWHQLFFLTAFIIMPALSLVHFARKVLDAPVWLRSQTGSPGSAIDTVPFSEIFSMTHKIGGFIDEKGKLQGSVDWYPAVEPLILAALALAAWISVLVFLNDLFFAQNESPGDA